MVTKLPQASTAPCFLASASVVGTHLARQAGEVIGEIETAGDRADTGMKMSPTSDVTMLAEGRADDDADREIEGIALDREVLEFLQHGALPRGRMTP